MKKLSRLWVVMVALLVLSVFAVGCGAYKVEVINHKDNLDPFHVSIEGETGSAAPRIEPGKKKTFTVADVGSSTIVLLTVSRGGTVIGQRQIVLTGDVKVILVEGVLGGVVFEVVHKK